MRTANPALKDSTFSSRAIDENDRMTISGTVNKTGILIVLLTIVAGYTWGLTGPGEWSEGPQINPLLLWGSVTGGFIVAMITIFKQTWAPITAPIYAVLEGAFLGVISAVFEMRFPGIVFQAVLGTMGTLFSLLLAYRSGLIKATENFKLGVVAATGGIAMIYLLTIVLGFFGIGVPYIHESGPIGIGFSVFVVIIAALNLVLDFDFIEKGAERGSPKYLEWYAAFGLLVTLIWLYLEILRLLSKARSK